MITENGTQPRQIDGVYWVQNVRLTTRHSLLMNQSGTGFHHKYIQNSKDSSGIQFAISIILSLSPILVFKYKMVPGVAIIEVVGRWRTYLCLYVWGVAVNVPFILEFIQFWIKWVCCWLKSVTPSQPKRHYKDRHWRNEG